MLYWMVEVWWVLCESLALELVFPDSRKIDINHRDNVKIPCSISILMPNINLGGAG